MRSLFSLALGAALLFAACNSGGELETVPPSTELAPALTAGALEAALVRGGMTSLRWRGHELATGGVYYLIASCTGADERMTNIDSQHGDGVMQTPDYRRPCGDLRYQISFSGGNPLRAEIQMGPMPEEIGAISFALDLDKVLFQDFAWNGGGLGWWEGCANDWQRVEGRSGGPIPGIRAPCRIYDGGNLVGAVGIARRAITGLESMTLSGPLASVSRKVVSFSVTTAAGAALPVGFTSNAMGALEGQSGFVNHPGTAGLGGDLYRVPAGAIVRLVEEISVQDRPVGPVPCGGLGEGATLERGQAVRSCNSQFELAHQTDGNLVLYGRGRALWTTATNGQATSRLAMQTDGNLVLYSARGGALWYTATGGNPGTKLAVQDDGNVVLYSAAGRALWSTQTNQPPLPSAGCGALSSGAELGRGQTVTSCNGQFELAHQTDGNLVLYRRSDGRALWATGTNGQQTAKLAMQTDGNLVLYSTASRPLWHTGTNGNPGARLAVQDDGNLVLYASSGRVLRVLLSR